MTENEKQRLTRLACTSVNTSASLKMLVDHLSLAYPREVILSALEFTSRSHPDFDPVFSLNEFAAIVKHAVERENLIVIGQALIACEANALTASAELREKALGACRDGGLLR